MFRRSLASGQAGKGGTVAQMVQVNILKTEGNFSRAAVLRSGDLNDNDPHRLINFHANSSW